MKVVIEIVESCKGVKIENAFLIPKPAQIKFLSQGLHDAQVYPCLVHLCMRQSHSRGSWLTWKEAVKTLSNTLTTSMFNRQIIK